MNRSNALIVAIVFALTMGCRDSGKSAPTPSRPPGNNGTLETITATPTHAPQVPSGAN